MRSRVRSALAVGTALWLVACGGDVPESILEDRSGGPLRDEGCDWMLAPSNARTGVSFSATRQAVLGELPPRFLTDLKIFDVDAIVSADGEELARDSLRGWSA